ncbi:MAG: undecaprenyl/decaprenyl-phosphate alpha-N-acetylglucosaminyl 1-phosphate transferase [Rhodospirillales bacterium]|nr:undecaprenyl/decaprenyl-phosphate alpha-N-acetylglucosaminyl 1-phosphate transferase [Rhodospirillales bacterium]
MTNVMQDLFFYPALAFILVVVIMPLAMRMAKVTGFIDVPGGRKKHEQPVPPVGGLVLFPVFVIMAALAGSAFPGFSALCMAIVILLATGALDDRFGVPAWTKFMVQFVAAFLIVVPGQASVAGLGNMFGFGEVWLGFMTVPFAIIATVLLINAVNLMDGLDGLAGGKGLIVMFWLAVGCVLSGETGFLAPILVLMGCLSGFLVYNLRHPFRKRASVFLGDAGSLALGAALAWFSIHLARFGHGEIIEPIAVAWVLALPIFDTCAQFARRMGEGRHPFDADHHHFHHHFINEGVEMAHSTAVILILAFITGLIGVLGTRLGVPLPFLTYTWIVLLFVHMFLSRQPHRIQRIIRFFRGGGKEAGHGHG